jgi:PST family polysaccharide transporter
MFGGVAVTVGAHLAARAVSFVVTVVLARTTGQEGMGLVAAALLTVEFIDMIRDLGMREALIYQRTLDARTINSAAAVIAVVAAAQTLLLLAVAPAGAWFVDDPTITPVLCWLALLFPLNSLGSVPDALLQKSLAFYRRAVAELSGTAVKGVLALLLIVAGFGIWSLVWGILAGALVRSAAMWTLAGWRPQRRLPRWGTALRLVRYGRHIIYVGMLGPCRHRGDQLAILVFMGDAALGLYFVASRVPELAIAGVNAMITKVVFPAYASIAHDRTRLSSAYLATVKGYMALMAPVSLGLAAVADPLVPVVFGESWRSAVPVLQLLAVAGIPLTLAWSAGDVFKATGRPELLTRLTLVDIAVSVPPVWGAALAGADIVAVATVMLVSEVVSAAVRLVFMRRHGGVGVLASLRAAANPIAAAAVMAVTVLAFTELAADVAPLKRLVGAVVLGVGVYAMALFALDGAELRRWARTIAGTAG